MGTFLLLDISKVPSDSITQELLKSVFGIFGNQKLTRLDSNHMCRHCLGMIVPHAIYIYIPILIMANEH